MRKRERHYRTVLALYALRYEEELQAGYEHLRSTLGESRAFCIGWAVALEEIRDRAAPIHALAELF